MRWIREERRSRDKVRTPWELLVDAASQTRFPGYMTWIFFFETR